MLEAVVPASDARATDLAERFAANDETHAKGLAQYMCDAIAANAARHGH